MPDQVSAASAIGGDRTAATGAGHVSDPEIRHRLGTDLDTRLHETDMKTSVTTRGQSTGSATKLCRSWLAPTSARSCCGKKTDTASSHSGPPGPPSEGRSTLRSTSPPALGPGDGWPWQK